MLFWFIVQCNVYVCMPICFKFLLKISETEIYTLYADCWSLALFKIYSQNECRSRSESIHHKWYVWLIVHSITWSGSYCWCCYCCRIYFLFLCHVHVFFSFFSIGHSTVVRWYLSCSRKLHTCYNKVEIIYSKTLYLSDATCVHIHTYKMVMSRLCCGISIFAYRSHLFISWNVWIYRDIYSKWRKAKQNKTKQSNYKSFYYAPSKLAYEYVEWKEKHTMMKESEVRLKRLDAYKIFSFFFIFFYFEN